MRGNATVDVDARVLRDLTVSRDTRVNGDLRVDGNVDAKSGFLFRRKYVY